MPPTRSFDYEDEHVETYEPDLDGPNGASSQDGIIRAHRFVWRPPELIPRRAWLYPGLYVRQFVSVTIAAGAVGKTGECLMEAIALVLGRDLLKVGHRFPAGKPRRVWYWNGEDPLVEMERQVHAIASYHQLDEGDRAALTERLYLDSGRDHGINLVRDGPRGTVVINADAKRQLANTIRANRIDLSVFDPLADVATAVQNSNEAMNAIVKTCAGIAAETNSAIGLVHHSRKTNGMEVTVEDSRGGSALVAGTRIARVLNRMTASEGVKAGIKGNAYKRYFRMSSDKINLTPPEDDTTWRYLDSVTLPNGDPADLINPDGDSVRVVTKWEWPNAFAGLRTDQIAAFQDALDNEQRLVRIDQQSIDWVGHLLAQVLEVDTAPRVRNKNNRTSAQQAARARCKTIITTWIDSGLLVVEQIAGLDKKKPDRVLEVAKVGTRHTG